MYPPLPPPPDQLSAMPAWSTSEQVVGPRFAGFWARFAALLLDGLLLAPLAIALLWPTFRALLREIDVTIRAGGVFDANDFAQTYRGRFAGATLLLAVISYLYHAGMVGMWGATVGKFALHLRVRKADESAVTWREALLRPLLQIAISVVGIVAPIGLVSPVDYLWMLWDKQKQTLHDKVAGTIVVQS